MNVQIPLFCVRHGQAAGLESAVSNLISGIVQTGARAALPYASLQRLNPEFVRWAETQPLIHLEKFPCVDGGMWTRFVEETAYYNIVKSRDPVIFPNYFIPPGVPGRRAPAFTYIHDCQHRVFPQYFSQRKRLWLDWIFQRSLRRAARVFLISEFEKGQLARFYGDDSIARCTVVYNPVDWNRYSLGAVSEANRTLSEKRFILSVSHQYPHKNTATVVEAFVSIAAKFPDLHLVLVGRGSKAVTDRISAVDDASVRARISLTGFIRDADLGHLYKNCQAFVLASEYEGFGMPAVEAMGFAVPVIVTNGSSLPEITMGRGIYVEPNSPAGTWAETIAQQLRASRAHQHLADSAAAVRGRYQPAAIAESVMKCVAAGA
jgi:glycosyltransferase involved in cell wall biosynthesis